TFCTNAPHFGLNAPPCCAAPRLDHMLTRRHFLKAVGGLGALGISTTAYGFSAPVLRLHVARYNISPPQWPEGVKIRIAAIADLHACDPWMSLDHAEA